MGALTARWIASFALLCAVTGAAARLELNTVAVVHGVVEGSASCVTLRVELEDGVEHSGSACPSSSGAAEFALPLPLGGGGQPGRITVKQPASTAGAPGRLWQQLISLQPSVQLSIDMQQAEVLQPASAPAPTISAIAPPPAVPAPTCGHQRQLRCCTDLEHAADLSLPAYQALAFPAPTCPALQPAAPSAPVPPSTQQAPARPSLLAGLAAACALQAVAIAALLSRHGNNSSCVVASATGGCQTAAEAAAPVRRRPALIDACTSPLALLASPFVRNRRQSGESLDSIPEEHPGVPQQTQQQQEAQQPQHGSPAAQAQQGSSPQVQQGQLGGSRTPPTGSFGSLAPAPAGWTRDAWGRLQRQSGGGGGGAWGGKPAVQHPPPFGFGGPSASAYSLPGTAYRPYSQRQYSEE